MSISISNKIAMAAAAGLISAACGGSTPAATDAGDAAGEPAQAEASCKGENGCKHKGECKGESSCKGENGCEHKGECKGEAGCEGHAPE